MTANMQKSQEANTAIGNVMAADMEKSQEASKATEEEIGGVDVLAWNDPNEKRNPKNWALGKRVFHTALPSLLAFEITFASSTTVPATTILQHSFYVSREAATLPLSLYVLGIAFGPLFIAPLSETLGRRPVYIGTLTSFLVFTAGAGASNSFAALLVCRFLAGFGGSAGVAMGGGTVADIWDLQHAGKAAIFFILGPFLGPTLGPLAGAYILAAHDNRWRYTQWILMMVAAPIWVGILFMKETSKAQILKLKRENRSWNVSHILLRIRHHVQGGIMRPTKMLLTEPIVLSLTIYTAYAYAMVFSFFDSGPYILMKYYGFDARQAGLSFISVIIGYLLAVALFAVCERTLYAKARKAAGGLPAPEHRLYAALFGSCFLPIGLFWYAWEAQRGGHWALLVASGIPFGLGIFSLFLSTITYLVDVYKAGGAASALAANGILRYIMGAVFPLFTLQMYEKLGVHWAGSVFAFASLLLLPIPWVLFRYGHTLRARSHYETSDL